MSLGLVGLCPRAGLTTGQGHREMDGNLELPLHIAASDFDHNWQASVATGHACVPMRMDFKQIGVVKTIATGEGKVDLCWSIDDGRRLNRQSITLSRFKTEGQDYVCLGCPGCGRPRKHLFLVRNKRRRQNEPYVFICKQCSGIDTIRDPKSRRRPGPANGQAGR
jgi:hypothetical protein